MKSNDIRNRDEIRAELQQAIVNNDSEAFAAAFDTMLSSIEEGLKADYMEEAKAVNDNAVLASRGARQLTSAEKDFYQKFGEAISSTNPRQAVENLNIVLPETVVESVFDNLRTNHPLLSRIDFLYSGAAYKAIFNTNPDQAAQWGELCDEIVKELVAGFQVVDGTLFKLSAFIPVCKAALELGPEWLDRFVRDTLYEALANGLEAGIVKGTGKTSPIGMNRQVGEGVVVTDGVYPEKEPVAITSLDPVSLGNILATMAVTPAGKSRPVTGAILLVNPVDYLTKVFPATTIRSSDGTYRSDVLPFPIDVIQSSAVDENEAILGLPSQYLALAGIDEGGRIEYSDHYRFLEDKRVYLIKTYAYGMPKDNNAFVVLNIKDLKPAVLQVEVVNTVKTKEQTE